MIPRFTFPTGLHREVAELAGDFFSAHALADTILVVNADELQRCRLAMVREACARDLDAIPFFLNRGLFFQAFDRLYDRIMAGQNHKKQPITNPCR